MIGTILFWYVLWYIVSMLAYYVVLGYCVSMFEKSYDIDVLAKGIAALKQFLAILKKEKHPEKDHPIVDLLVFLFLPLVLPGAIGAVCAFYASKNPPREEEHVCAPNETDRSAVENEVIQSETRSD